MPITISQRIGLQGHLALRSVRTEVFPRVRRWHPDFPVPDNFDGIESLTVWFTVVIKSFRGMYVLKVVSRNSLPFRSGPTKSSEKKKKRKWQEKHGDASKRIPLPLTLA